MSLQSYVRFAIIPAYPYWNVEMQYNTTTILACKKHPVSSSFLRLEMMLGKKG